MPKPRGYAACSDSRVQTLLCYGVLALDVSVASQVAREAKRVVARLDRGEEQNLQRSATDQERVKLATMYSLAHKVCYFSTSSASFSFLL